ncbi:MAG: cupredoxin domain-containing protein [Actinobacteria bacterium]|nr:cupredoxin domain-containing protein [Actinomycetota bacterium]
MTPAVRAALLDVAAGLQGSHVLTDVSDPVGRPAHEIEFGNWGGDIIERLYVDPTTHELLAWTMAAATGDQPFEYFVVQGAGVVDSTEVAPAEQDGSIPWPVQPLPMVPAAEGGLDPAPSCSQGGPDLKLFAKDVFDTDCLEVEAGSPFTIEFHNLDAGVEDNVSIYPDGTDGVEPLFVGETVTGPGTITYEVPPLDPGTYVFRSDVHPQMNGTLVVD